MELLKKEQIRDRMTRLAAAHWQVPENEIEASFDPLLMLIFDVLAGEIESIGHQIHDVRSRLLNELSSIMLPHALLRAKPASCVLTATPTESTAVLNEEQSFSTVAVAQTPGAPATETELNFTPNGEVKLFRLHLLFLRTGSRVYKLGEAGRKLSVHEDPQDKAPVNEIHCALHSRDAISSLKGLQLFFDLKGHSEATDFYFAVQHARLFINGQEAPFTKGYYKQEQYETNLRDSLEKEGDYSRKIRREIAGIYAQQFITVQQEAPGAAPPEPPILKELPGKLQEEIGSKDMIYITLKLSRYFQQEVLERLLMSVNAFPVLNRKLEKIHFRTEKWINIIPLPVKGSYLDIKSIESTEGSRYRLRRDAGEDNIHEGQAIVRTTRVARNSSRDVRNMINSLLESIRDESAYFSRISNDFIASQLNEISKLLSRLQDRLSVSKDEKPACNYVLLRSKKEQENVLVQYWSALPAAATAVKAAATFKPVMHALTGGPCFALTTAGGGVETYSDYAQQQMLVRQLSSRGKIISKEDIRLLCFELFGPRLQNVVIHKKMTVPQGSRTGITRTIGIDLHLQQNDYTEEALYYLQQLLAYQLETHASFAFPFEIHIVLVPQDL
ncbi:type VI secretion system baseplate subunit TssF [Niabella drilacis]|uniref:Uncharacterized protein n=1 Tax=Niabella drilacis (strain DSM 25811 / CCM 8410 / CCUG 62505 / LMG 26954 / E90) TaxID=1285928 RepID=A0A1G6Z946_NIADE|nr:type VI secretion system baseplate subunit TssF [Niabella drilacis]SDD99041.1 hypothetical protein SAMN04487894_11799 [Niabella drilacis]